MRGQIAGTAGQGNIGSSSAKLGYDMSLNEVKNLYKAGYVSKEDFAAALRGYHAAIEATKSPQREKAGTFKD